MKCDSLKDYLLGVSRHICSTPFKSRGKCDNNKQQLRKILTQEQEKIYSQHYMCWGNIYIYQKRDQIKLPQANCPSSYFCICECSKTALISNRQRMHCNLVEKTLVSSNFTINRVINLCTHSFCVTT